MLDSKSLITDIQSDELISDFLEKSDIDLEQLDLSTTVNLNFEPEKIILDNYLENSEIVSDFDLLQHRNGWLDRNLDSRIELQDVSAFRCECPACNGATIRQHSGSDFLASTDIVATNALPQDIISTLLALNPSTSTPYKWSSNTITYSFYDNDIFQGAYYGSETGVKEVSDKIKQNVRDILASVETFVGLDFVEVTEAKTSTNSTFGQLRYMLSNNPGYAYAYYPFSSTNKLAGDVHLNPGDDDSIDTNGFQNDPGKHGYTTLIHETFHALGLEHPHESSDGDSLNASLDNLSTTVMTYDFKGNSPGTAMPYDIAALQQNYGATNYNAGDNTYVFGTTTDVFTINGQFSVLPNQRLKQTIWDSNGVDTLDFSKLGLQSSGYLFDLNEGGWLVANSQNMVTSTGEKYYNYGTSLAYNVTIENIIGTSSNDTIMANSAANTLSGYVKGTFAGNDTLINTDGLDTLNLSSYSQFDVIQTQNGNNLLINLGTNNGLITVKDYYTVAATNRLNLSFNNSQTSAIAEVGRITNVNQNLQTIALKNDYVNPVVIAQPLSNKATDPSIVRITNLDATNNTLSFYLQEAEYKDGLHINESFSYMVVEAGTWKLPNGAILEAGTLNTNKVSASGWENVSFESNFPTTPVVFSQVQSNNDDVFVRTRQKTATADGFSVTLEEEEKLKASGHGTENIGWLALSTGSGTWDGLNYLAKNTGDVVTHNWYQINSTAYTTTPNLLASIASFDEQDPAGIRYRETTTTTGKNLQIKIDEDQSFDTERKHTTEQVNLLTIQGSGVLTAQAYDPFAGSIIADRSLEDNLATTDFI